MKNYVPMGTLIQKTRKMHDAEKVGKLDGIDNKQKRSNSSDYSKTRSKTTAARIKLLRSTALGTINTKMLQWVFETLDSNMALQLMPTKRYRKRFLWLKDDASIEVYSFCSRCLDGEGKG